jgi:hypothetical protein
MFIEADNNKAGRHGRKFALIKATVEEVKGVRAVGEERGGRGPCSALSI